jgi:hypothetical protein
MIIHFTDQEMEQIRRLASIRHHSAGIAVPPKYSKLDAYGIDLLGAQGEAAVSKHFKWAVSTMLFTNRDDGRDFKTDIGTIQVKTRENAQATKYIQSDFKLRTDYGILCRRIDPTTIEIAGWFSKQTFDKYSEIYASQDGRISLSLSVHDMNRNIDELLG